MIGSQVWMYTVMLMIGLLILNIIMSVNNSNAIKTKLNKYLKTAYSQKKQRPRSNVFFRQTNQKNEQDEVNKSK